jgi:hypothetical protein
MPPNPHTLKPFVKGDKRINRDGRPKDSVSLSALTRRIAHEVATKKDGSPVLGPDGKPMTVIEAILRQWAQSPKQQEQFVERGFGKVTTPVDLSGEVKHEHKHDLSRLNDNELEQLDNLVAKLANDTE